MILSSHSAIASPPDGTDPDRKHRQHRAHCRYRAAVKREETTGERTPGPDGGSGSAEPPARSGLLLLRAEAAGPGAAEDLEPPGGSRTPLHTAASRPAACPPLVPRPRTPEARRVLQALLEVHGHLHAARRRGCAAECGARPRRGRRPGGAGRGGATRGRCRRHSWRRAGARRPQRGRLSESPSARLPLPAGTDGPDSREEAAVTGSGQSQPEVGGDSPHRRTAGERRPAGTGAARPIAERKRRAQQRERPMTAVLEEGANHCRAAGIASASGSRSDGQVSQWENGQQHLTRLVAATTRKANGSSHE